MKYSQSNIQYQHYTSVPGAPIFTEEEEGVKLLNGTTVELNWNPPESPNGIILDYQVIYVGYMLPILNGKKEVRLFP